MIGILKTGSFIGVLLLCMPGCLWAIEIKDNQQKSIAVDVVKASLQTIPDSLKAIGTLRSVASTQLSFLVPGHIKSLAVGDGAVVEQGDVIASLDENIVAAELSQAQANLEEATSKQKRYQLLKGSGVFSQQDYISVNSALKVAQARYNGVKAKMHDLLLVAPFSGHLERFQLGLGAFVAAGTPLVQLVQLDPLGVEYYFDQTEKNKVAVGQTLLLRADAAPEKQLQAGLHFVGATVDAKTGRFALQAIVANADNQLSPGELVRIHHVLSTGVKKVVVPQQAIAVELDTQYLYVVYENKARKRAVDLGEHLDSGLVVVNSGVKEGDIVIVGGGQKLADGQTVTVKEQTRGKSIEKNVGKKTPESSH